MTNNAAGFSSPTRAPPVGALGNPPEAWLAALPLYAELQRGEAARADEQFAHEVPDLGLVTLPAQYEELLELARSHFRMAQGWWPCGEGSLGGNPVFGLATLD